MFPEPRFIQANGLEMAVYEQGQGAPVVLLHGFPELAYSWRHQLPVLAHAGYRAIAPDQIGFGRSDKPTEQSDYSVARHVGWIRECMTALDLRDATFFGQDWGSLIGLTAALHEAKRFRAIVIANGALPDPSNMERMASAQTQSRDEGAFSRWQEWASQQESISVGQILADGFPGTVSGASLPLSDAEIADYDAPFPDGSYHQPEKLIPDGLALFNDAWRVLEKWEKPFITAYGKADPILGWADTMFQEHVPGAAGQPHRVFPEGPHFIQEVEAEALADSIVAAASAS